MMNLVKIDNVYEFIIVKKRATIHTQWNVGCVLMLMKKEYILYWDILLLRNK
jgi:hypothetical protein